MGIKTRPLLNLITKKFSGDSQFKLAHEKLLVVEQQHKKLVQEVSMHRIVVNHSPTALCMVTALHCMVKHEGNLMNQLYAHTKIRCNGQAILKISGVSFMLSHSDKVSLPFLQIVAKHHYKLFREKS